MAKQQTRFAFKHSICLAVTYLAFLFFCNRANAQAPVAPKAPPDELVLQDGEKLLGHLDHADAAGVVFKSDMAGNVTVPWKNIKELHSQSKYAVIPKGVNLEKNQDTGNIPQGTVSVADQKIEVQPAPASSPQTVPVDNTAHIVDQPSFQKATEGNEGFLHSWGGAATLGVTLVEATQNNETITSAINLVRITPTVDWMDRISRTTFDFSSSYGKLTEPGTPTVKTSIYHADAEQDRYFTPSLYVFGRAAFDHNFSQGLDLQQSYGGGIGWTVLPKPANQLDLKAEVDYQDQQFTVSTQNQTLFGSIFSEAYDHAFKHGLVLHQALSASPAWNNSDAFTGFADVNLKMPVFKRLSLAVDALDTYLHDPAPGFKKNSFQFTTGITYAIK